MGDRICIRITDGEETTPIFYGHWCGCRALKVMNETLHEPSNSLGNYMCNFIVKMMDYKTQGYSFDLWNDRECEDAADGDWYLWTYHTRTSRWTTTHPKYCQRSYSEDDIEKIIREKRPCLYRKCKCEHYGEKECWLSFQEKYMKVE